MARKAKNTDSNMEHSRHQTISLMQLSFDILAILDDIDDLVNEFQSEIPDDLTDSSEDESDTNNNNNLKKGIRLVKPQHLSSNSYSLMMEAEKLKALRSLNRMKMKTYEEHTYRDSAIEDIDFDAILQTVSVSVEDGDDSQASSDEELHINTPDVPTISRSRSDEVTMDGNDNSPMVLGQSESVNMDDSENVASEQHKTEEKNDEKDDEKEDSIKTKMTVQEMARRLYDLVDAKNRKYNFHTYTKCFIAKDAITIMVQKKFCFNRKDAIVIGRKMDTDKIIHHIEYEKKFGDNKHLFQFTIDDQHTRNPSDLDKAFGVLKDGKVSIIALKNDINAMDGNGEPLYNKMPSSILETLDLEKIKSIKIRHQSTMKEFEETSNQYIELPELAGWMYKRCPKGFKKWQKRWVIVRRTHMLWSKKVMNTDNPIDPKERAKFNNSITLLTIREIRPINSKRKRKFDVVTTSKIYHFRARTAAQRDNWVNGLQRHLDVLAQSMKFLRQSFFWEKKENNDEL